MDGDGSGGSHVVRLFDLVPGVYDERDTEALYIHKRDPHLIVTGQKSA